jgi:hypothetical protein
MLALASILGYVGAAQTEAASADTKSSEVCMAGVVCWSSGRQSSRSQIEGGVLVSRNE